MKTVKISKFQLVVPNTLSTIDPVTGHKALKFFGSWYFVSQTIGSAQPRIETTSRDTDLRIQLGWYGCRFKIGLG